MYRKIERTISPAPDRPLFIWDGECGFCHYWVLRWRMMTVNKVDFEKYQDVAAQFPDIPVKRFQQASQLIGPDGRVFSGPNAFFRTLTYMDNKRWSFLFDWYEKKDWFSRLTDDVYHWIARHRPFMYRLTRLLWGKNPRDPKPYWIAYISALVVAVIMLAL